MKRKFNFWGLALAFLIVFVSGISVLAEESTFDSVNCEYFSGTINAEVDFGTLTQDGTLILAMYNTDNCPVFVSSVPVQKDKLSYDFKFITDDFQSDYTVKVFCWKSDNSLCPLTAAFTADVQKVAIDGGNAPADESVKYESLKTVKAEENIIPDSEVVLGSGWQEKDGGYLHSKGYTDSLEFNINAADGDLYLLTFNCTNPKENGIFVALGDGEYLDTYRMSTGGFIILKCYGNNGTLKIKTSSNMQTLLTNISCRKISDDGAYEEDTYTYNTYSDDALEKNQSGFWNVAFGMDALGENINGSRNIAIGKNSLSSLESGNRNIAIGTFALPAIKNGDRNIVIGADGAFKLESANDCISIGKAAMHYGASRSEDIAIGKAALYGTAGSDASGNIGIGTYAGYKSAGKINVFIGRSAGYNTQTTHNVFIGSDAGRSVSNGWANTAIGASSFCNTSDLSKAVAIGYNAQPTKSNQVMLGGDHITETVIKGDLVVRGSDGVYRQIVFNDDGSIGWAAADN